MVWKIWIARIKEEIYCLLYAAGYLLKNKKDSAVEQEEQDLLLLYSHIYDQLYKHIIHIHLHMHAES